MKILVKLFYFVSFICVRMPAEKNDLKHLEREDLTITDNFSLDSDVKFILLWYNSTTVPFNSMKQGSHEFLIRKCRYINCLVTNQRNLLGDVTAFDAIVFTGQDCILSSNLKKIGPKKRSPHQKYVFANEESADKYPVCSNRFNNFFNWTWTYKLDSDAKWGYISVRDKYNNVIGPKTDMHWMRLEDMALVNDTLSDKLRKKSKTAAWFVSECKSRSGRENYVNDLQKALGDLSLEIDIYGKCGSSSCENGGEEACLKLVKKDYYFFLAFEESFSDDYVTENLLHALKNDAIPIVYGGANYTRFMPEEIYLNAREMTPKVLADTMLSLIQSPEAYAEYFRWKNHYSYHSTNENPATDNYCGFCELLNNKEKVEKTTVYEDMKNWWNEPQRCLNW